MRIKRGIYFALLAASLILISFFGGAVSYAFFFTMLFIPVMSYAYLFTVYWKFKIYQKVESRDMVANTASGYYFVFKNDSFVTFSSIRIRMFTSFSEIEKLPDESEFCLLPGEEFRHETRIFCKYRGEYEVGIKEILLTDFLGLFQFKYKMPGTIKALVSPSIPDISEISSLNEAVSLSSRESSVRKDEPDITVRDYEPGDPLRTVSWKQSAKTGRLLSRQLTGEERQKVAVFADAERYFDDPVRYLPLEDTMLQVILAVTYCLSCKSVPVSIYSKGPGDAPFHLEGMRNFQYFYENISGFSFREDYHSSVLLPEVLSVLSHFPVAVVILHELNNEIIASLRELNAGGTVTILYLIGDTALTPEQEQLLDINSFRGSVVTVPSSGDLKEVLQ